MCTVECVTDGREWCAPSGCRAAPNTHVRGGEWLNGCEGQLGSVSITRYM